MNENVRKYLAEIGSRGGHKSKRRLDGETARNMVRVREARKAFKKFHARCFWSCDPDYVVSTEDLPWLVEQLNKHGDREAWRIAERLCR